MKKKLVQMLKLKTFSKKFYNFFIKKVNNVLKKFNYLIIYRYGNAIGDHLYMTGVISKIYEKKFKIIVFSNYPELFLNNPKIYKLLDLNKFINKNILLRMLNFLQGESIKSFRNQIKDSEKYSFMKFYPRNIHIAHAACFHFEMNLKFDNFKNEIFFSRDEILKFRKKLDLPNNFAVIHSEAKKTYTKSKNWGHERIQNIINKFDKINWIQVGRPGEYELENIYKKYFNISLRELAYIIYSSNFLVCMEGMYNHMASAFEKKNFLIHIGFLTMDAFKYSNNVLIEKNLELSCYPCFSFDCDNHKNHCDNYLTSDYAIDIIRKNLNN